ncbi:MAG: hypothetical protein M1820_006099 [Bogoriella megaspora]|nr:MAG: hypothetical protein M1820_006099 [Bogoriella megaspora]
MDGTAWLTAPLQLTGSREFTCDEFTTEQCDFYMQRWHFWYIADYVYALPTIAFFMSALGIFIIGNFVSQLLGYRMVRGNSVWMKFTAGIRYLSYRGFYIKALGWNSAPLGLLLLGAAGTTYFFCMDLIPQPYYWSSEDFGSSPPLGTRSGWLALACMPFVFATASKANWITLLTGVSHENLQVFHRWISYAFFVLALMHTFPFIVYHIRFGDMVMEVTMMSTLFYWTGIVALVFQAWLTFASHSLIRNLNYEFFKATHIFAVVMFVIVFFWHCDYTLTSWHYFIATAAVYVPCFVFPWLRTCFEYGFTRKAYIHVEDNGFTRITIPSVNFNWTPGQHCFLRFTSFGFQAISSHPFTICSLPSSRPNEKSELVFYIRHQRGLTEKLYHHALKQTDASVPVLIDGPYGGVNMQKYTDAARLLVVAGGSGAGWTLPFIELALLKRQHYMRPDEEDHKRSLDSAEKHSESELDSLRVVLATRDTSSRIWFLRTVGKLLSKYSTTHLSSNIDVQVYLTGEAEQTAENSKNVADVTVSHNSASSSENINVEPEEQETTLIPDQELHGRPELPLIINEEGDHVAETGQSLNVFVCGPTTMQNDVRNAVAGENLKVLKGARSGGVYLHLEHFSWA